MNDEYKKVSDIASQRNIDAAIKYASVAGGLQRLFMVRLSLPKETISKIWETLPPDMQNSDYGKSIRQHLDIEQIEEGSMYYDFTAQTSDGEDFRLSRFSGKNILFIYGGLTCMGQGGRDYLDKLYNETDRDSFEIVTYWLVSDMEDLKEAARTFETKYLQVSDFLGDRSPIKITYGAQAMPTCFLIDKSGTVIFKQRGLPEKELTKLKQENKL